MSARRTGAALPVLVGLVLFSLVVFGLVLTGGLVATPAGAHRFAPSLLELTEPLEGTVEGQVDVRWKQPLVRVMGSELRPVLPPGCTGIGAPNVSRDGTGLVATWSLECPGGLVGRTVGVEGIAESRADVLLRVALVDGRSMRAVLTGDQPTFTVSGAEGKLDVAWGYAQIGVEHILGGFDHLLFVLALVLLVGWGRSLLWTVTAFTLGHSITLALAVLGVIAVPQAPVEAAIALSIFFLALELVRAYGGETTWVQRMPWLVAGSFGLLHGLGFAGALAEVGLPQQEIPLALFAFNVGIEVGQLAFVAIVLIVWHGVLRGAVAWPWFRRYVPAYGIGSLAAFWLFERLASLVSPVG